MCAPAEGDAERRQKLIEAFCAETMPDVAAEGELRASIPTDQFSAMRDAPDFKSPFRDLTDDGHLYGLTTGYILGWCWSRAQFPDTAPSASLNAACRMIAEAYRKTRRYGGSLNNIKKHKWPIYRSVAHLWTAYILFTENGWLKQLLDSDLSTVQNFISVSEYFRRFGETHHAKNARANETLLSVTDTWKCDPSDFEVPQTEIKLQRNGLGLWDARVTWAGVTSGC